MLPEEVFVCYQGRYRMFQPFFRNDAVNMINVELKGFFYDSAFTLMRLPGDGL